MDENTLNQHGPDPKNERAQSLTDAAGSVPVDWLEAKRDEYYIDIRNVQTDTDRASRRISWAYAVVLDEWVEAQNAEAES